MVHSEAALGEIIGISPASLWRLKRRGFRSIQGFRKRPMPNDFAIQLRHLTFDALAKHYGASNGTIARWKRELRG